MSKNLYFLDDGQSIASTVSQLHNYFKNTYSNCQSRHAELNNRLRTAPDTEQQQILAEIRQLDEEMILFGVLSDSLSVANRLLHFNTLVKVLGTDVEVYQVHLEDKNEQAAERQAAERRINNR